GVALDHDTLLVGAGKGPGPTYSDSGAVYVFVRSGAAWTYEAALLQPAPNPNSWFGMAMAVQHDTAIVAARQATLPGAPTLSGAVYVFQRTAHGWLLVQTLGPPAPQPNERFGGSVALDGDTLMVGTVGAAAPGGPNAVYVYTRSGGI